MISAVCSIWVKWYEWLNVFDIFIVILKVVLIMLLFWFLIHLDFAYCSFRSHSLHCWSHNWGNSGKLIHLNLTDRICLMCSYSYYTAYSFLFYYFNFNHFVTYHYLYIIIFIVPSIRSTLIKKSLVCAVVCFVCSTFIIIWMIQYFRWLRIHTKIHTDTIFLLLLSLWLFHILNLSIHNIKC